MEGIVRRDPQFKVLIRVLNFKYRSDGSLVMVTGYKQKGTGFKKFSFRGYRHRVFSINYKLSDWILKNVDLTLNNCGRNLTVVW